MLNRRSIKAFTLVELLVVIGIIALLMGMLMPALSKARHSAVRTQCAANLRTMGQLWHMYANDFKGAFPDWNQGYGTWELLPDDQKQFFIQRYKFRNGKSFYCPSSRGFTGGAFADEDWNNNPGSSAAGVTWIIGYSIFAASDNAVAWDKSLGNRFPPPFKSNEKRLAERPLFMDVTLKYGPPYTPMITWGYSGHTEGLRGGKPAGENACYGDGHVSWKNWSEIKLKLVNYPNQFERWF